MAVTIPGTNTPEWGRLQLQTAPASELITTNEAKAHLRIEAAFTDDDSYIDSLITAAREIVELHTRVKWAAATYYYHLTEFPGSDIITIPDVGYIRGTGFVIEYYDTSASFVTLAASNYTIVGNVMPASVWLKADSSWPSTIGDRPAVRITLKVGYNAATSMPTPKPILQAMLMIIGHLYENRQDVVDRIQYTMPQGAAYLIQSYRDITV